MSGFELVIKVFVPLKTEHLAKAGRVEDILKERHDCCEIMEGVQIKQRIINVIMFWTIGVEAHCLESFFDFFTDACEELVE